MTIEETLKEFEKFLLMQKYLVEDRLGPAAKAARFNPNLNMTAQAELKIINLLLDKLEEIRKQVLYSTMD